MRHNIRIFWRRPMTAMPEILDESFQWRLLSFCRSKMSKVTKDYLAQLAIRKESPAIFLIDICI